jgi:hypothetical protein
VSFKKKVGLVIAGVVALAGTAIGLAVTSSSPPKQTVSLCSTCVTFPSTITSQASTSTGTPLTCPGADVGSMITQFLATLSPGTEVDFNPNGTAGLCYTVATSAATGQGIFAPQTDNITLNGQGVLLYDPSNSAHKPCTGSCQMNAIITVNGGHPNSVQGAIVENFLLRGGDHPFSQCKVNGQCTASGVLVEGTLDTTLTNINVGQVYGDCLTLEGGDFQNGVVGPPVEDITVTNYSGSNCGRQGVSPVSINGAVMRGVNIGAVSMSPWDFEADSAGIGAENVIIKDCTFNGLVNITGGGAHFGPITMQNCVDGGAANPDGTAGGASSMAVEITNLNGTPYHGRMLFSNDHFRCGSGPGPCFDVGVAGTNCGSAGPPVVPCTAEADLQLHSSVVCIGNSTQSRPFIYRVANASNADLIANTMEGYWTITGGGGNVSANSTATVTGGTMTNSTFGTACTTNWPFSYNPTS